jgi:hypothetical protein
MMPAKKLLLLLSVVQLLAFAVSGFIVVPSGRTTCPVKGRIRVGCDMAYPVGDLSETHRRSSGEGL